MSILKAIGNTPLVEIKNIWQSDKIRIFAKIEGCNPSGSIKDRIALYVVQQAIRRGELKPGMEIIEATSGNTGISLAMVAAALGYKCTIVMPKSVSVERSQIISAYGASLVLVDGKTDDAIEFVEDMIKRDKSTLQERNTHGYWYNPNQFDNDDNWLAHFFTTAPEIAKQIGKLTYWTGHNIYCNPTHFISAYGTTGTIRGCSAWFKNNYIDTLECERIRTKVIGVSPKKNSKIQGLKNLQFQRVPKIHDPRYIDETIYAIDKEAFEMTRRLAREEGIFCGISSGAAMSVAIKIAKEMNPDTYADVVVIFPDNGNRYLSEGVFK